ATVVEMFFVFFFSSRRRHTRFSRDWSSDVCSSDLLGNVNVVVWSHLAERQRRVLVASRLLGVEGRLETVDGVRHVIAARLHDESPLIGSLATRSRDFR